VPNVGDRAATARRKRRRALRAEGLDLVDVKGVPELRVAETGPDVFTRNGRQVQSEGTRLRVDSGERRGDCRHAKPRPLQDRR
jgi:hypothetical protein